MEPIKKELTLDESIKQVMQTLPPVVRTYLAQGKYTVVAQSLMSKYGLRIDQAGVLEREIMLLLMGIENPDEFTKALLEEAKLEQKTIDSIVQDINMQIFMPLRAEEMKTPAPTVPASVTPPQPAKEIPRLVVPAAPTKPQPEKFFHLQNKIPAPAQAAQGAVRNPGLRDVLAAVVKPSDASRMLEDHEEPHIEFTKEVPKVAPQSAPIQPRPIAPGARFVPTPVSPRATQGAVPNLPGALPPQPVPKVEPPKPAAPVAPPAPPAPPASPQTTQGTAAKPYTADPYREPIE